MTYKVVEKKNNSAVHAICDSEKEALNWMQYNAPEYVRRGYFIDKTLTADSFTIIKS